LQYNINIINNNKTN